MKKKQKKKQKTEEPVIFSASTTKTPMFLCSDWLRLAQQETLRTFTSAQCAAFSLVIPLCCNVFCFC